MSDAEKVRRIYNKRAAQYDAAVGKRWVAEQRANLFGRARGDVLELGVGSGVTFSYYPPDLSRLTGLDDSEGMLDIARPNAAPTPLPVTLQLAVFQTLPRFVAQLIT